VTVTVWSAWAVGLVAAWASAGQSMAQEKTCVFEGTARNSVTRLAVGKVSIRLIPKNGAVGYSGSSTADGAFRFEGVVAGDYGLEVDWRWVLADPAGHAISTLHLAPGQTMAGNSLWITPESGISGKVIGPDGEPLPEARVHLIAQKWRRGKRVYMGWASKDADEEGEYRFSGLPPGRYLVYGARPQRGPLANCILEAPGKPEMRIAGRYYPNAAEPGGATAIELRPGEEPSEIDLHLPLAAGVHVTGGVESPAGPNSAGVMLGRSNQDQILDWDRDSTEIKDGKFDLAGVTPGSYFLYFYQVSPHDFLTGPKVPITVTDENSAGVVAPPIRRFALQGRIRVEGGAAPESFPVQILGEGSEADDYTSLQRRAEPKADGTFAIGDLAPDRYAIRIADLETGKEGGYYLKSVLVNGAAAEGKEVDLTSGPAPDVELVLSSVVGSVEGTVKWPEESSDKNTAPEPAAELTVVMVPEKVLSGDKRPLTAYLDQDGQFRLTDLEPGSYRAFAVTHYDPGLWQNSEFLRQMSGRGTSLEIAEKGSARIEVRVIRASEVRLVEERIE
jgi:hypothetical protein